MATRMVFRISLLLLVLTACTPLAGPRLPNTAASFDFNWHLRGDRQAGPVQVFDNGQWLWIQFAAQQTLPAVFGHNHRGEHALTLEQRGQFHVVSAQWDRLIFRVGQASAQAYRSHLDALRLAAPQVAHTLAIDSTEQTSALDHSTTLATAVQVTALSPEPNPIIGLQSVYAVQPSDLTLRQALERWAAQAGWVFDAEHWSVSIDYPISASAQFEADFQVSVQALLASTEMAEQPLQPCFYQNQVLRVISWVQVCDHTAVLGEQTL